MTKPLGYGATMLLGGVLILPVFINVASAIRLMKMEPCNADFATQAQDKRINPEGVTDIALSSFEGMCIASVTYKDGAEASFTYPRRFTPAPKPSDMLPLKPL